MDIVESAKFDINICFTCTFSFFGIFFYGSGSGFFLNGSGFLADLDPDSGKKVRSGSETVQFYSVHFEYCIHPSQK